MRKAIDLITQEQFRTYIMDQKKSYKEIGQIIGVSNAAIARLAEKFNLKSQYFPRNISKGLLEEFLSRNYSLNRIWKTLEVGSPYIVKLLNKYNLSTKIQAKLKVNKQKPKLTKEYLRELLNQKKYIKEIKEITGKHTKFICDKLKEFGLKPIGQKVHLEKFDWPAIQKDYDAGMSIVNICLKHNVGDSLFRRGRKEGWLKIGRPNIAIKDDFIGPKIPRNIYHLSKEKLQNYIDRGLSIKNIAKILDVDICVVNKHFKKYNLQTHIAQTQGMMKKISIPKELMQKFIDENYTIEKIHELTGKSNGYIYKMAQKYNLKIKKLKYLEDYNWKDIQEYHDTNKTLGEVKNKFGVGWKLIKKAETMGFFKRNPLFLDHRSVPQEYLEKILIENNYIFIPRLKNIVTGRNFEADFAFPQIKLILEVNGAYHYKDLNIRNNGEFTDKHKKRAKLIEKEGWEIIDIRCDMVFNKKYIRILLELIKTKIAIQAKAHMAI